MYSPLKEKFKGFCRIPHPHVFLKEGEEGENLKGTGEGNTIPVPKERFFFYWGKEKDRETFFPIIIEPCRIWEKGTYFCSQGYFTAKVGESDGAIILVWFPTFLYSSSLPPPFSVGLFISRFPKSFDKNIYFKPRWALGLAVGGGGGTTVNKPKICTYVIK